MRFHEEKTLVIMADSFVMVARYFVSEDDLFRQLQMDPNIDDEQARALIEQVVSKGYSPPSREKGLSFKPISRFQSVRNVGRLA
jgi:hypothetical protein